MSDLSGEGVRVLLIGTADHSGSQLPAVPAVERTITALRDRLVNRCGVPDEHIRLLLNPPDALAIGSAVTEEAKKAKTILLVYYIGHGLWSSEGQLYLAASSTSTLTPGLAELQAYSTSMLRQAIAGSPTASTVVVLDCCFSGRTDLGSWAPESVFQPSPTHGLYLLGSAEQLALAPEDQECTTFTGDLISLLDNGDPLAGNFLTLDDAYHFILRRMWERSGPLPHRQEGGRSGHIILSSNRSASPELSPMQKEAQLPGRSPYLSLQPFGEEDSKIFHGRDELTSAILKKIADRLSTAGVMLLVGASGSGKSSLLQAGLLARMRRGDLNISGTSGWPCISMTPGSSPVQALAARLAPDDPAAFNRVFSDPEHSCRLATDLLADRPGVRLILLVDQLEEIFTLCEDEGLRSRFIRCMHAMTLPDPRTGRPPAVVIGALRADFYSQATRHPELSAALQDRQFVIEPMKPPELRAAIEQPATMLGLELDEGLADLVLHELGAFRPQGPEPGSLPLLSHSLWETWKRREGRRLTVRGYRESGGIERAIERSADDTYQALTLSAQLATQSIMLRLIKISGDVANIDTEPIVTARPVNQGDLLRGLDPEAALQSVKALDAARLITTDREIVRISHERLLQAWPLLQDLVKENREWLILRDELAADAKAWTVDRDPSLLYRGGRLDAVRERVAKAIDHHQLESSSEQFFEASVTYERQRGRIRRGAIAALVVLTLIASTGAFVAWSQSRAAQRQAQVATARSMVAGAEAVRESDPRLALQLGVAAYRLDPNRATNASLLQTLTTSRYEGTILDFKGRVESVAMSPKDAVMASGDDNATLKLWDVSDPHRPQLIGPPLTTFKDVVSALAWRPDGKMLVVGDRDSVSFWDMSTRDKPRKLGQIPGLGSNVTDIVWAADGQKLVVGNPANAALLQVRPDGDLKVAANFRSRAGSHDNPPLAMSADGRLLAVADGSSQKMQLWDVADPQAAHRLGKPIPAPSSLISDLAFSPDGDLLVMATEDVGLTIWNLTDPASPRKVSDTTSATNQTDKITSMTFTPDGTRLICSSQDGTVQILKFPVGVKLSEQRFLAPDRTDIPLTGHRGPVLGISLSKDGSLLATAGQDGSVMLWDMSDARTRPHLLGVPLPGQQKLPGSALGPTSATLSAGGDFLADGAENGQAMLWDVGDPGKPVALPTIRFWTPPDKNSEGGPYASALSADGRFLATPSGPGDFGVKIWKASGRSGFVPLPTAVSGHTGTVVSLAWSADGAMLASADVRGAVRLTDMRRVETPAELVTIHHGGELRDVLLASSKPILVSVGVDDSAKIWDISNPRSPRQVGTVPTGLIGSFRSSVGLSADGRFFVVGHTTASFSLWDISTPEAPRKIVTGLTGKVGPVSAVAFSKNADLLATGSVDGSIILWDISDIGRVHRIGPAMDTNELLVVSLVFLPGDGTLVAHTNSSFSLWDVSMVGRVRDNVAQLACERLNGEGMTRALWSSYAPELPYPSRC
ncbi:hypothetical protein [Nonomuraea sp. NPDC003709]|uniref:caspase, EACC1-associated type n=1 Tax=Nonomuraea sp. NPDC003709 TaxID=3154450 RepID=UPI0033BB8FAA